jgi:hypothetical protein
MRELIPGALRAIQHLPAGADGVRHPEHVPEPTPPAALPDPNLPAWARVFAPHVPFLLNLAAMRADVEYWAEQITDQVDGERLTFIEDQLVTRGPLFREEFFRVFSDSMQHRSWFETFFDALTAELAAMRAENPNPTAEE